MSNHVNALSYTSNSTLSIQEAVKMLMTGKVNTSLPISEDPGVFLMDNLKDSHVNFLDLQITKEELKEGIISYFNSSTIHLINELIEKTHNHNAQFLSHLRFFSQYTSHRSLRHSIELSKYDIEDFNLIEVKVNRTQYEFTQLIWQNLQNKVSIELSYNELMKMSKRLNKPAFLIVSTSALEFKEVVRDAFIHLAKKTHDKLAGDITVSDQQLLNKMNLFYSIAGVDVELSKVKRTFDTSLPTLQPDSRKVVKLSNFLKPELTPENFESIKQGTFKAFGLLSGVTMFCLQKSYQGSVSLGGKIKDRIEARKNGSNLNQFGQAEVNKSANKATTKAVQQNESTQTEQPSNENQNDFDSTESFVISKPRTVSKTESVAKPAEPEKAVENNESTEDRLEERLEQAKRAISSRKSSNVNTTESSLHPVGMTKSFIKHQQAQQERANLEANEENSQKKQPKPQTLIKGESSTEDNVEKTYLPTHHLASLVHSDHKVEKLDTSEQATQESSEQQVEETEQSEDLTPRRPIEKVPFDEVVKETSQKIHNEDDAIVLIVSELINDDLSIQNQSEIEDAVLVEQTSDIEEEGEDTKEVENDEQSEITESSENETSEVNEPTESIKTNPETQALESEKTEIISTDLRSDVDVSDLSGFSAKIDEELEVSESIFAEPEEANYQISKNSNDETEVLDDILSQIDDDDVLNDPELVELIEQELSNEEPELDNTTEESNVYEEVIQASVSKDAAEETVTEDIVVQDVDESFYNDVPEFIKGMIVKDLPEVNISKDMEKRSKACMPYNEVMKYLVCFNLAKAFAKNAPFATGSDYINNQEMYDSEFIKTAEKLNDLYSYLTNKELGNALDINDVILFKVPLKPTLIRGKLILLSGKAKIPEKFLKAAEIYDIPLDIGPSKKFNPFNYAI